MQQTCNGGSAYTPIACTLYTMLLHSALKGEGKADDDGVKLALTASELALRISMSTARVNQLMKELKEMNVLNFESKRVHGTRYLSVVIFNNIPKTENDFDARLSAKSGGVSGTASGTKVRKKKEKKEEFSPQTPFIEERKVKKKERVKKEKNKKTREAISEENGTIVEGRNETPEEQQCARASAANQGAITAAGGNQGQQGARASATNPGTVTAAGGNQRQQGACVSAATEVCGPQLGVRERREALWEQLKPYTKRYGIEVVQSFYTHWVKYNQVTDMMDFETDPKFELELYLHEWYLNRQMFKGKYARGGSVAQEIAAEKQMQQKRMREQEGVHRVERERERLKTQIESVPHLFITMVMEEGVDLAKINADGITAIIQQRIEAHLLSTEEIQTFADWQTRRNNAAEALRRLEAG
ncbi:MAG: hypothetical protein K6F94_09940 [Bacteroidaceae bacterium]|nr:hypothetical protein [Bacteroidaceae bacterium]